MTKICICGHFGGDKDFYDGQTIKTKTIYKALIEEYGKKKVNKIDTYKWKKNPIRFFIRCVKDMKNTENMIVMPAQNGVKVFIPLFVFLNRFYHKKIFYIVIGGWLPELLEKRKKLAKSLKKIDKIFVETQLMKKRLKELGINNTEILLNFKNLNPIKIEEINTNNHKPLKLCIFSRIIKEKGIEDAIKVVTKINGLMEKPKCILDLYGQIEKKYEIELKEILKSTSTYIEYKGIIDSESSVNVLKNYDILLFPTKFSTEGLPGTLIDAYCAGLPIISSNWNSAREFIIPNETGLIYNFNDIEDFEKKLDYIIKNSNLILDMKKKSIEFYRIFKKENAIVPLLKELV